MKLLVELNTFEDDTSNSSLKESENNEITTAIEPLSKSHLKVVDPDANHGA